MPGQPFYYNDVQAQAQISPELQHRIDTGEIQVLVHPDGSIEIVPQDTGGVADKVAKKAEDKAIDKGADLLVKGAAGKFGLDNLLGTRATSLSDLANPTGAFSYGDPTAAANAYVKSSMSAAPAAEASGFFTGNSLLGEGAMGYGDYIPGVAGLVGLYDLANHRERIGTGAGYLEGAGAGAGIGWTLGGPVGAGIGAGVGLLGNVFGLGHKSRTKGEENLRTQLADQGVMVPNSDVKEWELNPVFQKSRNESDLTGKDIIHAADFYARIPGYSDLDAAKQEAIANEALKDGLIREQLGKINLGSSSDFDTFLQSQLATPSASSSGANKQLRQQIEAEDQKRRKKAALNEIMPDIMATPTRGPDYGTNPGELIKNPYL